MSGRKAKPNNSEKKETPAASSAPAEQAAPAEKKVVKKATANKKDAAKPPTSPKPVMSFTAERPRREMKPSMACIMAVINDRRPRKRHSSTNQQETAPKKEKKEAPKKELAKKESAKKEAPKPAAKPAPKKEKVTVEKKTPAKKEKAPPAAKKATPAKKTAAPKKDAPKDDKAPQTSPAVPQKPSVAPPKPPPKPFRPPTGFVPRPLTDEEKARREERERARLANIAMRGKPADKAAIGRAKTEMRPSVIKKPQPPTIKIPPPDASFPAAPYSPDRPRREMKPSLKTIEAVALGVAAPIHRRKSTTE